MTKIKLEPPVTGEKNTVAEPKVGTALKEVEKFLNENKIESTDNLKVEGIKEESLSKALQEKLTTKLGFTEENKNESFTAVSEKHYQMEKAGSTATLPAVTKNRIISFYCVTTSVKIKASEGAITGDFLSAPTEITLLENQHVIVFATGANWRIIAGEPKREQKYEAAKTFTKAEAEAGIEPSAIRPAFVVFNVAPTGLTIGGIAIEAGGPSGYPVPAGQKWKTTVAVEVSTLLQ